MPPPFGTSSAHPKKNTTAFGDQVYEDDDTDQDEPGDEEDGGEIGGAEGVDEDATVVDEDDSKEEEY